MCRRGYETLATVRTRTFDFDDYRITAQFNPGRMASSTAKTDAKSIQERKCFLCPQNLPPEQRAVKFARNWLILVNPFPIFPEHFTIPHTQHTPQQIRENFATMLDLARAMSLRYIVFYNGPKCGASAPDHLHFQAGTKGFLPLFNQVDRVKRVLVECEQHRLYRSQPGFLPSFVLVESTDRAAICETLGLVLSSVEEPMMNILTSYDADRWRMIIFYRSKHRPSFYFAEGNDKLLLSPAAVEMGGVLTLPIERDFERLTREHVAQTYREVCPTSDDFDATCEWLRRSL
jgi:hypothetical protein